MKYYTAQFKVREDIPDVNQIKAIVDELVLKGGSSISIKYGGITEDEGESSILKLPAM
jgi:hypothetical protein